MALSFVALIGAGLFLRSLDQARAIDPGFDADRLAVLSFNLSSQGMPLGSGNASGSARSSSACAGWPASSARPTRAPRRLAGGGFARSVFLEGQDVTDPRAARLVQVSNVGEGYLETIGVPVLRGRDFTSADTAQAPRVVIVNETMAQAVLARPGCGGQALPVLS